MRIVPPNSVLHRRSRLKPLLALGAIVAVGGCAKFPEGGAANGFTRIIFRFEVAGRLNTQFDDDVTNNVYAVAIRASDDINPQPQLAPQAIIGENNPNGIVAGSPTHLVLIGPNASEPYELYRFYTQEEVPFPEDPDNPINLNFPPRSTRGRILNFQQINSQTRVVQFELFTNLLADTDAEAQLLNSLQVNFLTMNRRAGQGSGNRISDSLGIQTTAPAEFEFVRVDLRANGTYDNSRTNIETEGDVIPTDRQDPDVDIVNWSIEVQRP